MFIAIFNKKTSLHWAISGLLFQRVTRYIYQEIKKYYVYETKIIPLYNVDNKEFSSNDI